jgi:hypothetical protein
MITIKKVFSNLFSIATSETEKIYREWDRQRARSLSPSETAEIDAIFSRSL